MKLGHTGVPLPTRYLGLNVEAWGICRMLQIDSKHRARYEQLFENLGTGVLHVGGQTSDIALWRPHAAAVCSPERTVITTHEVRAFLGFARRIGWTVIWGLPLARFDPSMAAREAAAVKRIGGSTVSGFSIGNEPDLYVQSGVRSRDWTYSQIFQQWLVVRHAVKKAVPSAQFQGPDNCCNNSFFISFAAQARRDVSALSFHFYAGQRPYYPATASYLMGSYATEKLRSRLVTFWQDSARPDHLPLDVSEGNTFSSGGVRGVSNTFAAAVWLTDVLFQGVRLHLSQFDVQASAGDDPYSPIGEGGRPKPMYYALLAYRTATANGTRLVATKTVTRHNVTSYAIRSRTNSLEVAVVNKDVRRVSAEVVPGKPFASASYMRLQAPRLTATSGVKLGRRAVSRSTGAWSGRTVTLKPRPARAAIVEIPAHSAVFLTFAPRPTKGSR